jgi:hypothetical protein
MHSSLKVLKQASKQASKNPACSMEKEWLCSDMWMIAFSLDQIKERLMNLSSK